MYLWEPCFVCMWKFIEMCEYAQKTHICRLAQPTSATQEMNMITPSIFEVNMTLLAFCIFLYIFPSQEGNIQLWQAGKWQQLLTQD